MCTCTWLGEEPLASRSLHSVVMVYCTTAHDDNLQMSPLAHFKELHCIL